MGGIVTPLSCSAASMKDFATALHETAVRPAGPGPPGSASGQVVRLVGFMVQRELPLAGQFFLTPRPVAMAEHADGEADDLPATTVTVVLPEAQRERFISHQPGPLALSGRLEYGPAEDTSGRVSWIRLYIAADALAAQPSAAATPHSH